jgi:hypothetical protein
MPKPDALISAPPTMQDLSEDYFEQVLKPKVNAMTYRRVIPRDLFNEANLLKCLGQLYLLTERYPNVTLELVNPTRHFCVEQFPGDGSLFAGNVMLLIKKERYPLSRPLNSREPWPLYATTPDDEEVAVFNDDGTLTDEFKELCS